MLSVYHGKIIVVTGGIVVSEKVVNAVRCPVCKNSFETSEKIGKCPVCGSQVSEKAKAFFCADRSCGFALWKNDRYFESIGKSLNKATAQKLLADGWIKLKGCKSRKTGKSKIQLCGTGTLFL